MHKWFTMQKINSKICSTSSANTHNGATIFIIDGMVWIVKKGIFEEENMGTWLFHEKKKL